MSDAARTLTFHEAQTMISKLRESVSESIYGQEDLLTETLTCLLAGGHILMTGAPGLAKTTLVRVFAKFMSLEYGRIQFTPDLLPTDILGTDILNIDPETNRRSFEFSPGPIFANLLLADEINRASPRTQSALLEAMQERSCTIGGKQYSLPSPFMVFATQNPFESEGAFPLPEAQLDRFLLHTLVQYPDVEAERRILTEHSRSKLVGETFKESAAAKAEPLELEDLRALIKVSQSVAVPDDIIQMIAELVRATRPEDDTTTPKYKDLIWYGAGPRAGISLISVARSLALMEGQEAVRWQHIKRLAKPAMRHRIRLTAQAHRDRISEDDVINEMMDTIEQRYKLAGEGIR
ncbi:MAG: AAA family ATPase [Pseudobacteriovorax sp.]|nr:AAA family ATPase [Pseudobacteriovorax sp.]